MSRPSPISRRHQYLFPILAAAALASSPALSAARADTAAPDDPIAAVVDGKTIHQSDLTALLQQLASQNPRLQGASVTDPQIYPHLVDELVNKALLYGAAEKSKVDRAPDVKKALAAAHEAIVTEYYARQLGHDAITDKAEQAYYQKLLAEKSGYVTEIHLRQIIVDSQGDAANIIAQLNKGADFAKLVQDQSLDKNDGGVLPWVPEVQLPNEFAEAISTLQKGQYTPTPVQTKYGWHVIQVLDTRPAPFADVKDIVDNGVGGDAIKEKVDALKNKAKITEYDPAGKVIQPK